ncbi:hypothetical protein AB0M54_40215 [Actinoplanes sp. NPDC051470]|uniref:hypothetical protein n=1 Tax=unclassified Actinoplanes TaxID=2626549 RepID=UPI00344A0117
MLVSEDIDATVLGLHNLALAAAGRLSGAVLSEVRWLVADGRLAEAAEVFLAGAADEGVSISPSEVALLGSLVSVDEVGPATPLVVRNAGSAAREFLALDPELVTDGAAVPVLLDLTADPATLEPADEVAVAAVKDVGGAYGLWRSWRLRDPAEPYGEPVPVFVLKCVDDLSAIAGGEVLQSALSDEGVGDAEVEALGPGSQPQAYHREALGRSALLWAAKPLRPVTVARVFDRFDPRTGPAFDVDHPLLADSDQPARLLDYLRSCPVMLTTTQRDADLFDQSLGLVVPQTFTTDGTFVWTGAIPYYAENYGIAPDPRLMDHVRASDYRVPPVDDVDVHRAVAKLMTPPPIESA